VLVTPLQVAQMTQAVGNKGSLCRPTLMETAPGTCHELSINEDDLKLVLAGMIDVCSTGGTAFPFFPHNQPYIAAGGESAQVADMIEKGAIACKTGTAEFGGADERGYRKTQAWFTAILGTQPINELASQATESGTVATESGRTHLEWLNQVKEHNLPKELVMVALVESDETEPFKEGSQHAAPVIKQVVDWMMGE
jgi:hypothetical protein